jgi:hypothetical protein
VELQEQISQAMSGAAARRRVSFSKKVEKDAPLQEQMKKAMSMAAARRALGALNSEANSVDNSSALQFTVSFITCAKLEPLWCSNAIKCNHASKRTVAE